MAHSKLVWMHHPDHGIQDMYDQSQIEAAKKVGWKPGSPPGGGKPGRPSAADLAAEAERATTSRQASR